MKTNSTDGAVTTRKGVALIAVLGFLSILVLMAVALLVSMRTERLASEAASDDDSSKFLLEGSLAAALDDIDDTLANTNLADGPVGERPANIRVPKNWAILWSSQSNLVGGGMQLISGEVTNWIPRRYLSPEDPDFDAVSAASSEAKWVYIHDPTNPVSGRLLGRYAYLALDCTGQLDANLVSDPAAVARTNGTSPGEVRIRALPDVGTHDPRYLSRNLENYHRFSTFPEILFGNDGVDDGSGFAENHALDLNAVDNFAPYSLCYDAGWWDWNTGEWRLPTKDIRSWTAADAEAAFLDAGYTAAQAQQMGQCFGDYVDTDFRPTSLTIPCCEPVPMLNELIYNAVLTWEGNTLTYTINMDMECWFPFLGANNDHTYDAEIDEMSLVPDLVLRQQGWSGAQPTWTPLEPSRAEALNPSTPTAPFMVTGEPFRFAYTCQAPSTGAVSVRCRSLRGVHAMVVDLSTGYPADDVQFSDDVYPSVPWSPSLSGPGSVTVPNMRSLAVIDPRMNHLMSINGVQNWDAPEGGPTRGAVNSSMPGIGVSISGDYEGTNMYVRNSTNIGSVAELGFIPTGDRWSTIDLFSPAGRTLLNKYRVGALTARTYTNGLINPNTSYSNVIVAAFLDAPIECYPGDPGAGRVDGYMATNIMQGFTDVTWNEGTVGKDTFDSPAGWVTTRAFAVRGTLANPSFRAAPYDMDNNKKESIIRNTYRLFNPNQNLFTVILVAQTLIDNNAHGKWEPGIDVVTGEKRAVALVWRDPFPDPETKRHQMNIRLFKYLDE